MTNSPCQAECNHCQSLKVICFVDIICFLSSILDQLCVKRFERSNGLDTALYKNYLYLLIAFTGFSVIRSAFIDSLNQSPNVLRRTNIFHIFWSKTTRAPIKMTIMSLQYFRQSRQLNQLIIMVTLIEK